jgi:2-polyprenyl-3-methyl-5-hydroxy-6-metoxy-1,4-benzoquinol methylase
MTTAINFRGEDLDDYTNDLVCIDSCILCKSKINNEWASVPSPFRAVKCTGCGFVWMQSQPKSDVLKKYYSDYIGRRRINNATKMQQRKLQYEDDINFLQRFVRGGRILDVGCNGGFFLDCFDKSFEKHGIEIDPSAVKYAQQNYNFGVNIRCGDILATDYPDESFDVLVMRGTIEHVARPIEVIECCSKLLKFGGFFYITATPNVDSLAAELFRDRWSLFHPVQHLWYFSPHTLSSICQRFGMAFVSSTFPYIGTAYENYRSDVALMLDEMVAKERNIPSKQISPPFYENMMSIIFKKL